MGGRKKWIIGFSMMFGSVVIASITTSIVLYKIGKPLDPLGKENSKNNQTENNLELKDDK